MFHPLIPEAMEIDYNKFTEQELQVILDASRTINYAFGQQFPSRSEQMALLIDDLHFRVINQIVIQAHNALRSKYIVRGIDPDAPDFRPDHMEK